MIERFTAAARADVRIRILSEGDETRTLARLLDDAEVAARAHDFSGVVAIQLDASYDALTLLLAVWMSDGCAVSIPAPVRRPDHRYWATAAFMAAIAGCTTIAAPARVAATAQSSERPGVSTYSEVLRHGACKSAPCARRLPAEASFVQFTSGSTGEPTGVVLSPGNISHNTSAVLQRLSLLPGDGVCSWLPLSHDMGLFGFCLSAFVALGPEGSNGGELTLLPSDVFRTSPLRWLAACDTHRATITASPPSVLDFFARRMARRSGSIDLSSLRSVVVGAEPIDASVLRSFDAAYAPMGLAPTALCPAYGLAEATLAVSIDSPQRPWHASTLSLARVDDARRHDIVACGEPMPGVDVRVGERGTFVVDGPSVHLGTVDATGFKARTGPFETSDVGAIQDGQIFVLGRADDVVLHAGRKIYPFDVERAVGLGRHGLTAVVAVKAAEGGFVVVCEGWRRRKDTDAEARAEAAAAIEERVVEAVGLRPRRIAFVANGAVPRTPSGKPRRGVLAAQLRDGILATIRPGD